jgi:SWI/SNF-related matrix-associated actin-dependent regulator of chromatin subfamily A3
MGKSLSILALITKTLDNGQEWAQQQNNSAEGKKAPKYSRSTLVVVPSARTRPSFSNQKGHLGLT